MINPNRKPIRRKKSYDQWANAMSRKFGISRDEFNAHPYDYAQYYKDNYDEAWQHVNNKLAPYQHFPDRYKTAQHPTFSDESKHSDKFGIYNPSGIRGGHWAGDDGYVFSNDQINYKWPIDKTAEYVSQEGVKLYTPYGKQIQPKYSGGKDDDTYADIWLNGNRYTYDQNAQRYVNSDYQPVQFAQGGILPEAVVTPSTRWKLDNPVKWKDIASNLYVDTPKEMAVRNTTPTMEALNAITGGMLNRLSASQNLRFGYDLLTGNFADAGRGFVYGNNGVVSDSFAQQHPYWSMLINGAADVGAAGGFGSGMIPGVARNLTPQQLRNQLFVAKPPVGYDGVRRTLKRIAKGVLSGEKAEIDNPWWLNGEYAEGIKDKLSIYAYVPDWVGDAERTAYLKAFGDHAIKARADAWRMHNRIPQMFNTFVPNPRHPGSFTDPVGIKNLKYIPPMEEGRNMVDFVNSSGGGIGRPKIKILGETGSIEDGGLSKFGVTTTSDWFDLHLLSRPSDRLIPRLQREWHKNIHMPIWRFADRLYGVASDLRYDTKAIKQLAEKYKNDPYEMEMLDPDLFPRTGVRRHIGDAIYNFEKWLKRVSSPPSFKFLKKLDDKLVNLEVGDVTGGRPVLMQYDIPWTSKTTLVENPQGSLPKIEKRFMPGFQSDDILPGDVLDWEIGHDPESLLQKFGDITTK